MACGACRYIGDAKAGDVLSSFGDLHGWLRSEQSLETVRAWRHSFFEQARMALVRAEGCRRSTFAQLNNNTPYTLRRATCALKHGVWLVMPPEFIVPGEQGVPFGSGFRLGPPTDAVKGDTAQSGEQNASSFLVGTKARPASLPCLPALPVAWDREVRCVLTARPCLTLQGIVAYTCYIEEEDRMVLLEVDWTNIVSLGDKRIWGDAAAQPPISVRQTPQPALQLGWVPWPVQMAGWGTPCRVCRTLHSPAYHLHSSAQPPPPPL